MEIFKHQAAALIFKLLQPIIYLAIKNKISCSHLTDLVRICYVEAANSDFKLPNKKENTISRIALLTGLTRKEIKKIIDNVRDDKNYISRCRDHLLRILEGWKKDKNYLDENEKPMILSLRGEENSFENLVKKYTPDIRAKTVLEELTNQKLIKHPDSSTVEFLYNNYVTSKKKLELLEQYIVIIESFYHSFLNQINQDDKPEKERINFISFNVSTTDEALFMAARTFEYFSKKSPELQKEYSIWLDKTCKEAEKERDERNTALENNRLERHGYGIFSFMSHVPNTL